MAYTKWKIERTDSDNVTTEVTQFHDPILEVNLGDGKDSFSFKVQNGNGDFDNYFKSRDKITIYRVSNTETITTNDILMVGSVSQNPYEITGRKEQLSVKGYNYSESVMGAIVFVDATAMDIPTAIQEALDQAGDRTPNFRVEWYTGNKSTTTTGGSFPTVGKRYFYKSIKQMLEELSANKFTNDGNYYWYVNNDNKLVWKSRDSFGTGSFNDSTDAYKSIKIGYDTSKVINYIIGKGGITPSGQPTTVYEPNYPSIAKHGMKFYYWISDTVTVQSLVKDDLDKDGADNAAVYPPSLGSSFTTKWVYLGDDSSDLDNGTVVTYGSTITFDTATTGSEANSQADYNQALKLHIQAELKRHARQMLNVRSLGQQQVDIEVQAGQLSWGLGDQISVILSQLGSSPVTLRVQEIQYTTDIDTFSLVQDIGSI